jgi:hypothetical protein
MRLRYRIFMEFIIYVLVYIMFVGCSISGDNGNDFTILSTNSDSTLSDNTYLSSNTDETIHENDSLDSWIGDYSYIESEEPDQTIYHNLEIYKEGDAYFANIYTDGFQSMKRLKALVIGDSNYIDMLFYDYLPENISRNYIKDDILLSFKKSDSHIYTIWGEYTASFINHQDEGLYFIRK